jgi:rubredoxin
MTPLTYDADGNVNGFTTKVKVIDPKPHIDWVCPICHTANKHYPQSFDPSDLLKETMQCSGCGVFAKLTPGL